MTAEPSSTSPRRRALVAVVVVGALGLGADAVYRARPAHPRSDLPVYLAGARRVLAGEDPVGARSPERGWPYYYPPTLATLVIPLAPLPLQAAAVAWFAASLAALGAGWWAARRAAAAPADGGPAAPPALDAWDLAAAAVVALPAGSALLRGQVGPLLLGLCGGAVLLRARGRDALAGGLVGLATAIKLVPGLLVVGLALGRRWRAVAAAALVAAAATLALPAPFLGVAGAARSTGRALDVLVLGVAAEPDVLRPGPGPALDPHIATNQALASQVLRRTAPGPARAALLAALAAVTLAAALAPAARGLAAAPDGLAALLAVPLVVAPVAWHHHHVVLAPLALLLAARARSGDRPAAAGLAALGVLGGLHFAVDALRPLGLLGWGTLAALGAHALGSGRPPAPGPG